MKQIYFLFFISVNIFFTAPCFAEDNQTIKLGAIYPLSGPLGFLGAGNRIGVEIALDLANKQGGVNGKKLELILEDSKSEPTAGLTAFKKLVEIDKVPLIFTTLTSVVMAIKPVVDKTGVLLFSESTHPKLVEGSNFILRNFPTVDNSAKKAYQFALENKYKKIAVLYAEEEWGQQAFSSMQQICENGDCKIVASNSFTKSATDLRVEILKIKAAKPDLVLIFAIGPASAIAFKQAKELGLNAKMIGYIVCSQLESVYRDFLQYLDNISTLEVLVDKNNQSYQSLSEEYFKRYPNRYLDQEVYLTFDAINIVIEALKNGRNSGKEIRDYILDKKIFFGASGKIEFQNNGDSRRDWMIQDINNGRCN